MRDQAIASRLLLLGGFAVVGLAAGSQSLWPVFVIASLCLAAGVGYVSMTKPPSVREILVFAVLFRLLLLPLLPSLSDDAYRYIWDGVLQWDGINPFLFTPDAPQLAAFRDLPIYPLLNSAGHYSVYPPVSQVVFFLAGWVPGSEWVGSYLIIKLAVVGAELVALFLLSKLASPRGLVLYAWNPLVIIETAGQAHSEGLMLAFLILTVWAYRAGRPNVSVAALTGAVWVKLYPILLVPFLLRRVGWRKSWIVLTLSGLLVAPYAAPGAVGNVFESLRLYLSYFEFYAAPYLILKALGYALGGSLGAVESFVGFGLGFLLFSFVGWLYVEDGRRNWNLTLVFFMIIAGLLVTATTDHPWYFLPILSLAPLVRLQRPAWMWLAALSTGTYLYYSHGFYWPFVWLGWGGWAILGLRNAAWSRDWVDRAVARILLKRAVKKVSLVRPFLRIETDETPKPTSVLDLGAGEGYVGQELQRSGGFTVTLCDIRPSNRSGLPFVVYNGTELPFGDKWFDATMLVYTLHHCEDHVAVIREAKRVTTKRIVVVESVFVSEAHRQIFALVDLWVNRIRSRGTMHDYQHFRKVEDWVGLFEQMGLEVQSVRTWGRFHKQALIALDVT